MVRFDPLISLVLVLSLASCMADEDTVELTITLNGSEYLANGIPATATADGYTIEFSRFLINLGPLAVAEEWSVPPVLEVTADRIWEVSDSDPLQVVSGQVPSAAYQAVTYQIAPARSTSVSGNVIAADVDFMREGAFSIYLEGQGSNGVSLKRFRWGFRSATVYEQCPSAPVETDGSEAVVPIKIRGEQLFCDDVTGTGCQFRFAEIAAADKDGDDQVTIKELLSTSTADLPDHHPGEQFLPTLWDFMTQLSTTIGCVNR